MMRISLKWAGVVVSLKTPLGSGMAWNSQYISSSVVLERNGVAIVDINGDGAADVVFSAGHNTNDDQAFALVNLGKDNNEDAINFSDPIPIGPSGSYIKVEAAVLSSGRVGILLSGGNCESQQASCSIEPAVLVGIRISGCGFWPLQTQCSKSEVLVWTDPSPEPSREAVFSMELGDGRDPAIVAAGEGGVFVYGPSYGVYSPSSYTLTYTLNGAGGLFSNSTELTAGNIGSNPGFVIGSSLADSGVLVAVYKTVSGAYQYFVVDSGLDVSDVDMADINGDAISDIIVASSNGPVSSAQSYYTISSNLSTSETGIFQTANRTKAVTFGKIYEDSELPDAIYGTENGQLLLFANQGQGSATSFLQRDVLSVPNGCGIGEVAAAELWPCTVSVIATTKACGDPQSSGNFIFTAETCDIAEWLESWLSPAASPAASPAWTPASSPASSPALSPTVWSPTSPFAFPTQQTPAASPIIPPIILGSEPSTQVPTSSPSQTPSQTPTKTLSPSNVPSEAPSFEPSKSAGPSLEPSITPTASPSATPITPPSVSPSESPTGVPSVTPSQIPTQIPSRGPTQLPSTTPSSFPSLRPSSSVVPSSGQKEEPSQFPSVQPTNWASMGPSSTPSARPSQIHSRVPTQTPSHAPSWTASRSQPSLRPSHSTTESPSSNLTFTDQDLESPQFLPSMSPSLSPTRRRTHSPPSYGPIQTRGPSSVPTVQPRSDVPSLRSSPNAEKKPNAGSTKENKQATEKPNMPLTQSPTNEPTTRPSRKPTQTPTMKPSFKPIVSSNSPNWEADEELTNPPSNAPVTLRPTRFPSLHPAAQPTTRPIPQPTPQPTTPPIPDFMPNLTPQPTVPPSVIASHWFEDSTPQPSQYPFDEFAERIPSSRPFTDRPTRGRRSRPPVAPTAAMVLPTFEPRPSVDSNTTLSPNLVFSKVVYLRPTTFPSTRVPFEEVPSFSPTTIQAALTDPPAGFHETNNQAMGGGKVILITFGGAVLVMAILIGIRFLVVWLGEGMPLKFAAYRQIERELVFDDTEEEDSTGSGYVPRSETESSAGRLFSGVWSWSKAGSEVQSVASSNAFTTEYSQREEDDDSDDDNSSRSLESNSTTSSQRKRDLIVL